MLYFDWLMLYCDWLILYCDWLFRFMCDDHVITRVHLDDVMRSEGYLLFYHKTFIEYD